MPCPAPANPHARREPRLLAHAGASRARRPGRERAPIKRTCAGNLEKRAPVLPRAGKLLVESGLPQPSWAAMAGFARHGSVLAARPNVAWATTADPEGSCGIRPRGDPSWRCSTAQARWQWMRHSREMHADPPVHCARPWQRLALGSNQTQSPPYSKERVPRDGHAMLTPRSPRIADRSVVLRCYGTRCNRIMGFVLRRTRCNRLAAECGPLQRTAHRCNSCAAASRAVVLWLLGRFGRSCGGAVSTCVTPAADCGVGVHCLAGSNSPISVISRVMGRGIYIAFY